MDMYITNDKTGERAFFPSGAECCHLIWEQDGYLFQIEAYGASEACLGELLKMAESIRPID